MVLLEGRRPPDPAADELARGLESRYGSAPPRDALEIAVSQFPGRLAAVSSFGAESAVLLHMMAEIDPELPVIFIDTGRHFGETKRHRDLLAKRLGLTDVRSVGPELARAAKEDPNEMLFSTDPDRCCGFRKVEPLAAALRPFDAWVTGRKRHQTADREAMPVFEAEGARVKVNPLAAWGTGEVDDYRRRHDLPAHPLVAQGFTSIGCMPCTSRVAPGEDGRAGRWRGADKTECGIHLPGFESDGSGI